MNICVVGTGYVGLVTGACFAEFGLNVVCVDKDEKKISDLQNGIIPIYEPGLEEIVKKNLKENRLHFVTDIGKAVRKALVIFITVGTPPKKDGSADLSYTDEVAEAIADNMDGYKVIVTKSTVPVGTGNRIKRIISKRQKEKVDFDVASNPEFLREGSAIEDFMRPNRVVIGAESAHAVAILSDLYSPLYLVETPFVITNIATAEIIKYASNAFLATKVSFINEIALLCEKVGADVHEVAKGMGLDQRIGSKFLHPGPGFGGSCFPKDTLAITRIAKEYGYKLEIVEAVIRANKKQRELMIGKIKNALGEVRGKNLGILGLSFKPNTDDIRESPAIEIANALHKDGARLKVYDPAAMGAAKKVLKEVTYCKDPYEVADGTDAIILLTEWNQFRNLDLEKIMKSMKKPIFIDLRNVYSPVRMKEIGFEYIGIGR